MEMLCGQRISLEFAKQNDKKLVFDMLVSQEVIEFMFNDEHPAPSWEEFNEGEPDTYFSGVPSEVGNYLLIKANGETIGSISYSLSKGKKSAAELDIWISSSKNLGKGYGREALNMIVDFIHTHYKLTTFIIRPWIKNSNAIKAYKKCGFKEMDVFNMEDYYSEEDIALYGEGDYGSGETINLVKEIVI
ncbi:GNAT family N-acetyltransferase [Anaerobacillus sp. CMMVII]|uniref:GNAT family N-acetyltransferase n=1 Tax=Anaerobacillus sp. CMMVII TaxID=2755588 RepID=UPI0021B79896|nr:GNAT family N-acetyltransferase [Anaerobacillus sp. CMMVII]MCT8136751.1 GNAT family N-acetyltransferase [Anaerobacillus sp. CMMVII]